MKTPLRDMYNPAFFERLCPVLNDCIPGFDRRDFIFRIFNNAWPDMELKERVRHVSKVLYHFLPKDFSLAAKQIIAISHALKKEKFPQHGFEKIFLADYVDQFGREFPELAAAVTEEIRKAIGAEYSIAPALIKDKV
ncbi:MAG: hypothetical protein WEB30_16365 [Cyclobacteriaceae bacterium]